jgi:Soluble lytic murein transglycosylase and related regulatory proteins (some contain LysM/invasin domains)
MQFHEQYETGTRQRFRHGCRICGLTLLSLLFTSVAVFAQAQQSTRHPQASTISVKSGETLSDVAVRANVSEQELAATNGLKGQSRLHKGQRLVLPSPSASPNVNQPTGELIGKRIVFSDGGSIDVNDVWKQGDSVWYRLNGTSQSTSRSIKSIENRYKTPAPTPAAVKTPTRPKAETAVLATWIYLVDGARLRVDEVREVTDGAWYNRGNVTIFLGRERIARIEREQPTEATGDWKQTDWSSGNTNIDQLIRTNASRVGVDPYLVFLVIEQESRFHTRALSPKGAQGLMQLMPGTARRFGVSRPLDPGQNIRGGTQYLKELLTMFRGRVDLALASYNAGEGRVLDYGNRVPPFKETREYVKRISSRYKSNSTKQGPARDGESGPQ